MYDRKDSYTNAVRTPNIKYDTINDCRNNPPDFEWNSSFWAEIGIYT